MAEFRVWGFAGIAGLAGVFLQIRVGDSLESAAVILCPGRAGGGFEGASRAVAPNRNYVIVWKIFHAE